MKLFITYSQPNPDFDQSYADEFNFGEESLNNLKYNWSSTYEIIEEVKAVKFIDNQIYSLVGSKNGIPFKYAIPKTKLLKYWTLNNEIFTIVVSKSLLIQSRSSFFKKDDKKRVYFYFSSDEEFINPKSTIFISKRDYPEDLLSGNILFDFSPVLDIQ